MRGSVVVGMSGGVDSSVAAYLLKEAGYEVIGVTMQIWQERDVLEDECEGGCCGLRAVEDARRVCMELGIPHYVMNFRREFKQNVIDYFVQEYAAGRTPNPCIACNRHVKWEALLHRAIGIGADYIATGHYARLERLGNGRYTLRASVTAGKDQTYALYNLTQEQLARTLMPVGEYTKEAVRELARRAGLPVANKPDSQEICFVEDNDYAGFIEDYMGKAFLPGNFVDRQGNVMGRHKGIIHYTVGQRKGLGLSLKEPAFVLEIRPRENEVVLGYGREIFAKGALANQINFMSREGIQDGILVTAKIRYNHKGAAARLYMRGEDAVYCEFLEEQRAVTPGQAIVFYEGEYVLGGGTIVQGVSAGNEGDKKMCIGDGKTDGAKGGLG
ncbi:MAG: tRNA 2-thiouridine(34) synthase MnmA [Lachnospiraceae bacterium]|nr:tRNA 2-thiouridine(34) synthase MnmA [Lachnospiraceae bacterium]